MAGYNVVDSNILDKQGILNILRHFIFGDSEIELYDQGKVYNTGDIAYIIDSKTGSVKIITALTNDITGPFDNNKWDYSTLTDTINKGIEDTVVIQYHEPTRKHVQIWLTPDSYSSHYIPWPESESPSIPDDGMMNIIFIDNAVPMVDDVESANLDYLDIGDLIFDWEGEGEYVLEDTDDDDVIYIDEQNDIEISDDKPEPTNPAILWIDTDLTDDSL